MIASRAQELHNQRKMAKEVAGVGRYHRGLKDAMYSERAVPQTPSEQQLFQMQNMIEQHRLSTQS